MRSTRNDQLFPFTPLLRSSVGPHADLCKNNASAGLVEFVGLKSRTGNVRIQLYANNPGTFLEKGKWLERIQVPVTGNGPMNVCVPVPKPGNYAVYVRHDRNGNGKSDRSDGGGFSGNPDEIGRASCRERVCQYV